MGSSSEEEVLYRYNALLQHSMRLRHHDDVSITIHQLFIVHISVPDQFREPSSTDVYDDDIDDDVSDDGVDDDSDTLKITMTAMIVDAMMRC